MKNDKALRDHVVELLNGGHAHATFDAAVKNFPVTSRGKRPRGAAHSPWEVVEHIRLALWDILEFSRDSAHVSPEWPSGYWPKSPAPPSARAWNKSVAAIRRDMQALLDLVSAPSTDLLAPIPHGTGQTLLREALLVADHNAYHVGELVLLGRLLGVSPSS